MARRRIQDDSIDIEREFEERIEAKYRRGNVRGSSEPPKRDKKKPKPPFLLRILAWCGVILFCFVVGYIGMEYVVRQLGQPWNNDFEQTGGTSAVELIEEMQRATFSVFFPRDGSLVSENVEVVFRTLEDNVREAVQRILRFSDIDAVVVLHVFRDVDMVYIDLSSPFLEVLNERGAQASTLLLNGIVRTMNENFSLVRVRLLVDSRVVSSGAPVDLAAVWQL